jgi:hypothetical protein
MKKFFVLLLFSSPFLFFGQETSFSDIDRKFKSASEITAEMKANYNAEDAPRPFLINEVEFLFLDASLKELRQELILLKEEILSDSEEFAKYLTILLRAKEAAQRYDADLGNFNPISLDSFPSLGIAEFQLPQNNLDRNLPDLVLDLLESAETSFCYRQSLGKGELMGSFHSPTIKVFYQLPQDSLLVLVVKQGEKKKINLAVYQASWGESSVLEELGTGILVLGAGGELLPVRSPIIEVLITGDADSRKIKELSCHLPDNQAKKILLSLKLLNAIRY